MKNLFFLFVTIALLNSCKRDDILIASGIETRVYGKTNDFYGDPIPHLKMKVGEYKETNDGSLFGPNYPYFIKWSDSTFSDNNGNYDFTFKTSGNGNFYRLYIGENTKPNEPQVIWEPYSIDISKNSNDMTYIGKEFKYDPMYLFQLYPCKIKIQLNNVQTLPITLIHSKTYYMNLKQITSNETSTHTIYIDSHRPQIFELARIKNGIRQKVTYEFPTSNIKGLTLQDITVEENDFKEAN